MNAKSLYLIGFLAIPTLNAAKAVDLYKEDMKRLDQFSMTAGTHGFAKEPDSPAQLIMQNKSLLRNNLVTRYQQYYQGIPIIGAQVMVVNSEGKTTEVNGHILEDLQLNTNPSISEQQAIALAKQAYLANKTPKMIQDEEVELQIRMPNNKEPKLFYSVSFKTINEHSQPEWPFYILDAHTGKISKHWNNIQHYGEHGPGGNLKVHEYWYGKDGLPELNVHQNGHLCTMDSDYVKLVSLNSDWDWYSTKVKPFTYMCNQNHEENTNGAYSPRNDGYYFGQLIVDMYQKWYGLNALQLSNGKPMKLVMRVHFGEKFDNAFWDGKTMSFGDGENFYPLVTLDITGHEVTHGFTQQHSNLEYHDQSGALNESMSDMAGLTARAYLLETLPALYNKSNMTANKITWGVGETIMRGVFSKKALRFMDYPSFDGYSADCVDRTMARKNNSYCAITYEDVVNAAKTIPRKQGYIVHKGSGVFNRVFYLIAQEIGIKTTYEMMIIANTKYWTPTTDFIQGACGVLHASQDLNIALSTVQSAFDKVGLDTSTCVN